MTTLSKNDQIIALALELLEDAEMSRISVDAMVMKASRLARLAGDAEAELWLYYERHNYSDSEEISLKYLRLTQRWLDEPAKKAYFAGVAVHESVFQLNRDQLEIVKGFVPSGQWAAGQFQTQQQKAAELTNNMMYTQRILSAVRAQIHDFATRIYHERLFSHQAESIFEQVPESSRCASRCHRRDRFHPTAAGFRATRHR
jgi:hypothetical protein